MIVPLVLLVCVPASVWHGEHADEGECAVCHSGHQTADLSRQVEPGSIHASATVEPASEVHRVVSRRYLRPPARAPPG